LPVIVPDWKTSKKMNVRVECRVAGVSHNISFIFLVVSGPVWAHFKVGQATLDIKVSQLSKRAYFSRLKAPGLNGIAGCNREQIEGLHCRQEQALRRDTRSTLAITSSLSKNIIACDQNISDRVQLCFYSIYTC
jgi:hypothetical protein